MVLESWTELAWRLRMTLKDLTKMAYYERMSNATNNHLLEHTKLAAYPPINIYSIKSPFISTISYGVWLWLQWKKINNKLVDGETCIQCNR